MSELSELSPLASWEKAWTNDTEIKLAKDWKFFAFESVDSTMNVARKLVSENQSNAPVLVLAASQTHGRGRQGKAWESHEGAFLGTYVLPGGSIASLAGLSLVVGCALVRVVHSLIGADLSALVGLKWPNDLMTHDGRKLAGILVELLGNESQSRCLIGIGVNLSRTSRQGETQVSLEDLVGARYSALEFARILTLEIEGVWDSFISLGFPAFREEWQRNSVHRGCLLRVTNGEKSVDGRYVGVNEQGHLLLQCGEERYPCVSGSVETISV